MPDPVAELTLALLGNPASFEKMMAAAEARLDRFVSKVDAVGAKLQASLDRTLGSVSASAGKLDQSLQPVITALGDVGMSASVAGAEVRGAAAELRSVSGDARSAAASLTAVGAAGKTAGAGVAAGMGQTVSGTAKAQGAMSGFLTTVNRVRAAANRPIVQRVSVQRTGGAAAGAGGREGITSAGYGLVMAGGAILGTESELIKSGESTEDSLRRLYALAGETENYEILRREVLSIATQFGLMPDDVAKALYPIESLGFKGAEGLKVLAASANMAKGSQTDLLLVSDLISKTLNAYGLSAGSAGRLTDIFTRAIKDGVVPAKDYVNAYAGVMTISKNAGLSVEDTASALAVMTHNAKSAAVGGTQLRAFISGIIAPTKAMRDAAKAAGLEWLATRHGADELQRVGLSGTLDEITKATNGNVTALTELFPDLRKVQAGLALLNNGGVVFTRTLQDVQNSQGATSAASREMDKSLAQSGRNMAAAYAAAGSNLEDSLRPILIKIFTLVTGIINAFNRLPGAAQETIGVVAGVTGGVMLLAGAVLIVTRWVTTVTELFGRFAARGVSANAEVAASAEAAAVAEEGVGAAATEAGAAGVLAFGGGPLIAALAGLGIELYNLYNRWVSMREAIDQAAQSAQNFANQQKNLSATGEQGSLEVNRQQIATALSGRRTALAQFEQDRTRAASSNNPAAVASVDREIAAAKSDIAALQADYAKETARLHQIETLGGGKADTARIGLGSGGDVPGYEKTMLGMVGEKVGYQCGTAITKALNANGIPQTVSQLRDMARKDPSLRVKPGADGTYPNGTIFYFPKGGGSKEQHFAVGYKDQQGNERVAENTTAGGGGYKYRADRLFSDILAQHGGRVEAFRPPNVSLATLPPSTGGAEPDWAKKLGDKAAKTPGTSPGSLRDIDLSRVPSVATLPADLASAATNAQTFEAKLQGLSEAFAEHNLKAKETVKGYDELAAQTAYYGQRLTLTDNAIRNTQSAMDTLTPKTQKDAAAVKAAAMAYNSYADKLKALKASGGKIDSGQAAEVGNLRTAYAQAMDAFKADDAALKENQRVHSTAVNSKIADLEELGRIRDQQARKQDEAHRKDMEAMRQQDAAMRQFEEGVKAAAERASELEKINIELGVESEAVYRDHLVAALKDAQAAFGETSLEAAQLSLEIARIDWQGTADKVEALRQKYDAGDESMAQYIADLKELQKLTNSTSGHKQIQDTIDSATRQQTGQQKEAAKEAERQAEEQVQKITDKVSEMVLQIVHHAKTLPQVFRDVFQQILDTIIENFVKQTVAKIVGMVLSSNKAMSSFGAGEGSGSGAGSGGGAAGLLGIASSFAGGAGGGFGGSSGGGIFGGGVSGGGLLGGELTRVLGSGLGGAVAKALPFVGAALAVASLFGPHKQTPNLVHDQQYANVLTSFSPTIDSGYSGQDGLRTLLGPTTRVAAGVSAAGQAGTGNGHTITVNIASGAFTGVTDPQGHGMKVVQTIHDELARMTTLDNASRGNG